MLGTIAQRLREVTVRPTAGVGEREQLGRADGRPSLPALSHPRGKTTACDTSRCWASAELALVGWQAGAFKAARPRDEWIGQAARAAAPWRAASDCEQLPVRDPARGARDDEPRLAGCWDRACAGSRATSRKIHGHPALHSPNRSSIPAASPARATGRRTESGAGFARRGSRADPGMPVTWTAHGRPKEILVYPLVPDAREQLRALDDAAHWRSEGEPMALTTNRMGSLFECLNTVAEFRGRRGRRYPLATVLAIDDGREARRLPWGDCDFAEFAQALSQESTARPSRLLQPSPGALHRPHRRPPSTTSSPRWTPTCSTARCALEAAQSKHRPRSPWPFRRSKIRARRRTVVTPTGKTSSSPPPSTAADSSSDRRRSPTRATRSPPSALTSGLALAGRVVTVDALHTQDHTARAISGGHIAKRTTS